MPASSVTPGGTQPTPAATVVPLRDGDGGLEVLLLKRNDRGQFGGMWVFPGGQVDSQDWSPAGAGDETAGDAGDGTAGEIASARRAAVREAWEEAGLELDEKTLVTLSFWLPPPESPRRFATWFFLGPAPAGRAEDVVVDLAEVHEHRWATPGAAMASRNRGEIELAPPTFTTLWWLSKHATAVAALEAATVRDPQRFQTRIARSADGTLMATLWAGDAGYSDGSMERPGARRRLVMDPAGWRVEITSGN